MPDAEWNREVWAREYAWTDGGEEWSAAWGTSEAQWYGTLFPRLHRFLPAQRVLEIAPGYGRWTHFLLKQCDSYAGVDLPIRCIDACKKRFNNVKHANFYNNDGKTLPEEIGFCFDLVFSFDSLVHVEIDVICRYFKQILDVLSEDGVAFVHHSNLAEYNGTIGLPQARDPTVSAEIVSEYIKMIGGRVLCQEIINWQQDELIDCITLFSKANARFLSTPAVRNSSFMAEASIINRFQRLYSM